MPLAEYLARMSAAEYAELPDRLPVVWYAFPAVTDGRSRCREPTRRAWQAALHP